MISPSTPYVILFGALVFRQVRKIWAGEVLHVLNVLIPLVKVTISEYHEKHQSYELKVKLNGEIRGTTAIP